jgi:glycosyltransferase involved in cell wall biosynthesis
MNKSANQPIALLLDLSGNEDAARKWANQQFPNQQIQSINKADLKWGSRREALASVRAIVPYTFAVFTSNLNLQSSRCSMILFGALAGARQIALGDSFGRTIRRSRFGALLFEAPRLVLELLFGYAVIVPISWILTLLLGILLRFRDVLRRFNQHSQKPASRFPGTTNAEHHKTANKIEESSIEEMSANKAKITPSPLLPFTGSEKNSPATAGSTDTSSSLHKNPPATAGGSDFPSSPHPQTALYIRATLTGAREGGMVTHVAGFTSGAQRLGHHLKFLVSGEPESNVTPVGHSQYAIKPSANLSATRALFELWNNLLFTVESIRWLKHETTETFDFIYQRYSRFNWTGVALSIITGLPLALEFNGSEVWVSQSWDPVGQLALLKRFERLNQRAADFIFTVSEVERRNVIRTGVDASKVFANPNGVDTDKFRKDCGGREIRRQLGIEDKIVVGFLGTFGPWHGAPVLAEAATRVKSPCHFLFIGDGDERAVSEAKIAGTPATFAGRISHDKVAAYLDACDILVSPHVPASDGSEFFGSPTKLFEYLAMERPVVASCLGQIADVIIDDENGLLVEPGNVGELARALERLANDEALRNRLGKAARRTVMENFTWQDNAARVFDKISRAEEKMRR